MYAVQRRNGRVRLERWRKEKVQAWVELSIDHWLLLAWAGHTSKGRYSFPYTSAGPRAHRGLRPPQPDERPPQVPEPPSESPASPTVDGVQSVGNRSGVLDPLAANLRNFEGLTTPGYIHPLRVDSRRRNMSIRIFPLYTHHCSLRPNDGPQTSSQSCPESTQDGERKATQRLPCDR